MNPATESYIAFLKSKIPQAEVSGFEPPCPIHPSLFPHQRDISEWSIRGGRRACFASFGLGKTRIQLEIARQTAAETGGRFLIICPLGVRQEFTKSDGPSMGIPVHFVRTTDEILAIKGRVFCTNYESVREDKIDLSLFNGVSLDEASVLRSYGSKTYQTFLPKFKHIPYRYVFTATPSPNRYKELIHYAGFLGIMDTGEALTRFFQRDSEQANNLTLYPHMEKHFWHWLASWAVFIQRPSDLGYSDEGYDLPPIYVHWHRIAADHRQAWTQVDSWGQHQLFLDQSQGLKKSAETKRDTISLRVAAANELIRGSIMSADADLTSPHGYEPPPAASMDDHVIDRALCHVQGHYVLRQIIAGKSWSESFGTGGSSVPVTWFGDSAGLHITENETRRTIKPAAIVARAKQWREKQAPHWIIWHDLEDERRAIESEIPSARTVFGSQDIDDREDLIMGFTRGEFPILATKPIIAGSGCNFQRHCHRAIFLGVGYKFNDFIQAVHRIHRFQQTHPVHIHIIHMDSEDAIVAELKAKWKRHDDLQLKMTTLIRQHKLTNLSIMELSRTLTTGTERTAVTSERFTAIHNDTVLECIGMPENSVDFICTSIPFGNQYEYSPSFNDFGHNSGDGPFFEQMDHLVPHLLRILKPGRIAAIHVKDRIMFGNVTGDASPTVNPFSDLTSTAFRKHGFRLMARITIDTDVVRENNQTYRLGWSENAKDSTKMGAGMPEYVLVFRKLPSDLSNAYADVPVEKPKSEYTRADWQIDAAGLWRSDGNRLPDPEILKHYTHEDIKAMWIRHSLSGPYDHNEHVALSKALEEMGKLPASFMLFPPVSRNKDIWTDIARMRTLNSEQSRRNQENHVCPLQLDIIRRLITRYTNAHDLVFDPFGGIGSVPYQAIKMGRRGLMTELNAEYWRNAVGYCEMAENEITAPTLFDLSDVTPAPSDLSVPSAETSAA